ncbi:MAG: NADP-dependent phosphogluconate dehydrogenase, partial [Calditrichia bacterium]
MANQLADMGIIGMGVMGGNLALNIASHDFSVAVWDRNAEKVENLTKKAGDFSILGAENLETFISTLKKPRVVLLLVPAGKPVDQVIDSLMEDLEPHDIIIDGGNSHFTDTNRRLEQLTAAQIQFIGMGISGGSKGARYGPSMMPGGPQTAYERVRPMLEKAAAKVNGDSCVAYLGKGSAGHYVKMVHNGIEYAFMQLIAESFHLLKTAAGLDNRQISQIFEKWDNGKLGSFLIEITSWVLQQKDELASGYLVDVILDAARAKGTGKWTSQDAMDLQVPVPAIDMAVIMRDLSAYKTERTALSKKYQSSYKGEANLPDDFIDTLEDALYFSLITTFAQGFSLLHRASGEYGYDLNLAEVARIWRGGCIIRAKLLDPIRGAFQKKNDLANLLADDDFGELLKSRISALRSVAQAGI